VTSKRVRTISLIFAIVCVSVLIFIERGHRIVQVFFGFMLLVQFGLLYLNLKDGT